MSKKEETLFLEEDVLFTEEDHSYVGTVSGKTYTSATTLLALLAIYLFGGEILKGFSLAMIFGVIFGTYSSIYIANTVLVRLKVSQKTILKEED